MVAPAASSQDEPRAGQLHLLTIILARHPGGAGPLIRRVSSGARQSPRLSAQAGRVPEAGPRHTESYIRDHEFGELGATCCSMRFVPVRPHRAIASLGAAWAGPRTRLVRGRSRINVGAGRAHRSQLARENFRDPPTPSCLRVSAAGRRCDRRGRSLGFLARG